MSKNDPQPTSGAKTTVAQRLSALRKRRAKLALSQKIYKKISEQVGWFLPGSIAASLNIPESEVLQRLYLMRRQGLIEYLDGRYRFEVEAPPDSEGMLASLMGSQRYTDFIPRRLRNAHPPSL
jgi:hypothetical protein